LTFRVDSNGKQFFFVKENKNKKTSTNTLKNPMDTPKMQPIRLATCCLPPIPDRVMTPIRMKPVEHWDADTFWRRKLSELEKGI
jgi:hypothetical protein